MSTGPGMKPGKQWNGIYSAVVYSNNDPLIHGRVKLRIPQVTGTAISNWAVPVGGSGIIPVPGTSVKAMFEGGDVNYPVYFLPNTGGGLSSTVVQLLGQLGTFGALTFAQSTSTGHSFTATPVPGWAFGPGESVFYAEVMSDGQIIMGTVPQTNNELKPTMNHAEINVFDPLRFKFYSNIIPTSLGSLTATNSFGGGLGGTDVGGGDLRKVMSGSSELLIFTCGGYYFNWNIGTTGLYPAIGFLQKNSNGDWVYNQSLSLTGDQWEATNPTAYTTIFPSQTTGIGGSYWSPRTVGQIAVLPSGNIVVGHYFNANGFNTGCISVVSPTGALLCNYQIPTIVPSNGTLTTGAVRDVESDPTGVPGDERFVIVYDGFGTTTTQHPFQEFTYNSNTQTITPLSVPCVPTDTGTNVGFSIIDSQGTLYITTNIGLGAGNTSVYIKQNNGNRNTVNNAPANPGWPTAGTWGTPLEPDYSLAFPRQQGLGIFDGPMTIDPVTTSVLHPGASGKLGIATPSGAGLGPNLISAPDSGFETANLLSADDATFATSLGDWGIFVGSITRVIPPVSPPFGTEAAQLQEAFGACQALTSHLPVIASTPYQFRTYFLAGTTGRSCEAWVRWFDSGGSAIVDSAHTTITDNSTTWTVCDVSGISAPSNAAFVALIVQIDSSGAGENHYFASNFLWNMSIPDWTSFITTIVKSTAAAHTGTFSMRITAPFNNELTSATSPAISVVPGQEYVASAWFLAASGQPSQACTITIAFLDVHNSTLATASSTLTINDNTSTWTLGRTSGWAPPNSVNAKVSIQVHITTANTEGHLVDDVSFQAQPFTAISPIDMGVTVLRRTYPNLNLNRGCVANRRYFIPLQQTLNATLTAEYNAGNLPPTSLPQFLVSVDLSKVLSR